MTWFSYSTLTASRSDPTGGVIILAGTSDRWRSRLLHSRGGSPTRANRQLGFTATRLLEIRSILGLVERHLVEVVRDLTTVRHHVLASRLPAPVTDAMLGSWESVGRKEDGQMMSDERVLRAAQTDEVATQRRIEELRQEIENAEERLREVTSFIRKYREYEGAHLEN